MPVTRVNGVGLYWEERGEGEPLVLVHGSWGDHDNWAAVVPGLARRFRVITYDRRGHSRSERPASQGSIHEDADDLAALLEALALAPAHVAGNSGGGGVALDLAARRPELLRTLTVHEPAVFAVLADDPDAQAVLGAVQARVGAVVERLAAGDHAGAAELFVDTVAFGPGAWAKLPQALRDTFLHNAPTFLDETRDPEGLTANLAGLRRFERPALLTKGTESAPFFPRVIDKVAGALPHAEVRTFAGAGHVPHLTHPEDYVRTLTDFLAAGVAA